MPQASIPKRPLSTALLLAALWFAFYASFTLVRPALLDDADSVHAEVAREMLLRHDWVTLYANGIRYLEKAPLLYWSMAASMRGMQLLGHGSARALAVAARIPLALTVLALVFAVEAFARRAFHSPGQNKTGPRAGLYAALILLSSPGIFLFTRILIPDAMLCLWLTLAMLCFWLTEESDAANARVPHPSQSYREGWDVKSPRLLCYAFAACCALGVLTKGLIGVVFPIAIVALYLLLTRGWRGAVRRVLELHPFSSALLFLVLAAPWHVLVAWANPARGHPGELAFALHPAAGAGHWQVPLPTDGNVHGWAWFYFVNEQVLRYLNLRVPRDYDTVPLWLFWGLCLLWLMPWSMFLFKAIAHAWLAVRQAFRDNLMRRHPEQRLAHIRGPQVASLPGVKARQAESKDPDASSASASARPFQPAIHLLLLLWAALPLLFFSLSTRQEYYVLPALPAVAILIAGWLANDMQSENIRRANLRCTAVLLAFAAIFAAASIYFLLHTRAPAPNADLAALLQQNPSDYAMSMGHFLDLNARALALFWLPLALAAASLFLGPLASYLLRRRASFENSTKCGHTATLALAAGAFGFLLAAHLALQTFAPVLSSAQLAEAIAPQVHADDLIVIHQEYEYGSTLGFYLQRPSYARVPHSLPSYRDSKSPSAPLAGWMAPTREARPEPHEVLHVLTDAEHDGTANYGRSSNLWYGSYFPDAPAIFETTASLAQKWLGPQRIFLWQDLANQPSPLPAALSPVYVIAESGGKEIVSNQPNAP